MPKSRSSPGYQVVRGAEDFGALRDAPYAGIVIHDLEASVVRRGKAEDGQPSLQELLEGAREVLEPGGFAYVSMRNRLSYSRVRDGFRNPIYRRCLTAGTGALALAAAGFGTVASHAFLLEGPCIAELVAPAGYLAARGAFSLAEKFKRFALGRRGARVFAAGYGLVARTDASPPHGVLERLLNGHDEYGLPISPGPHELKRYLVMNWGKVILSIGPASSKYGEYVLVLTRERQPTLHRRREALVLVALAERPLSQAGCIPRFLGEFAVDGASCFVMRAIAGVSIDRHSPWHEELTVSAVEFIAVFHSETRSCTMLDERVYGRLFGSLFARARERNEQLAPELERLEREVRAAVIGVEMPVVWLHGDYKIENMLFNETTRQLQGVIDWEHSEESGLPRLDLLYLLAYNRVLTRGGDLLAAVRDFVVDGPTEFERRMFERYDAIVPGTAHAAGILNAMFFIHHIGVRFKYALESDEVARGVRDLLLLLTGAVAARKAAGAGRVAL